MPSIGIVDGVRESRKQVDGHHRQAEDGTGRPQAGGMIAGQLPQCNCSYNTQGETERVGDDAGDLIRPAHVHDFDSRFVELGRLGFDHRVAERGLSLANHSVYVT